MVTGSPACAKPSRRPEPRRYWHVLPARAIRSAPKRNLRAGRPCHYSPRRAPRLMLSMVRLQKFLAEAGVASRRASEEIILAGGVTVNGEVVKVLGTKVDPARDRVTVDGRPVKTRRKLYV